MNPFITVKMDGAPNGTSIQFEDGRDVICQGIAIEHVAGKLPTVALTLASFNATVRSDQVRWRVADPANGETKDIRRIDFADGTHWEAPACSA